MRQLRLEPVPVSDNLRAALTAAGLLVDDLDGSDRDYFVCVDAEGRAIGYSGIEACGDDSVLLRSLVILPAHRSRGHGRHLVELTIEKAPPSADVYLATANTASFFEHIGFASVERDEVPSAILATRQLSELCPASATIMKLSKPPT
ncbi:GNAT family N-acetyltransferase [Rhizobium grahamii]|uniref:GNAT family N-acetyltransferase n=1 Tax=Rhizobium grahamii TaxID=1120045 RepID=A0A370KHI1_9HYPH|nr:GNAT family N-acetyltransferase [Rhizobium grahamii]RDJ04652.1 GNAT family N-acetyltransferase [Rhizobium grahamii]